MVMQVDTPHLQKRNWLDRIEQLGNVLFRYLFHMMIQDPFYIVTLVFNPSFLTTYHLPETMRADF
jgi:hypothetical protein